MLWYRLKHWLPLIFLVGVGYWLFFQSPWGPELVRQVQRAYEVVRSQEVVQDELSSPALVDLSYDEGEITAEERWLYLGYLAYGEAEQVPERFVNEVPWRRLFVQVQVQGVVKEPSVFCGFSPEVQEELERLTGMRGVCE